MIIRSIIRSITRKVTRGTISGPPLGPNMVINGDFTDGLNDWTVTTNGQTVEVVGGRLRIVTDGTSAGVQQLTVPIGPLFRLEFDYEAVSGSLKAQVGSTSFPISVTGSYSFDTTSVGSSLFLFRNSGPAEGYFDNVSIREIL